MMSTLTKRIITALFLITFVILGTWLLPPFYFSLVTGIILLLVAHEWARLVRLSSKNTILLLSIMALCILIRPWISNYLILGLGCLFWIGVFYPVLRYKGNTKPRWAQCSYTLMGIGFMVLYPFWVGICTLYDLDKKLLLLLILIVAAEDTGAYFSGKRWGVHKLIPHVSPGKTWEGLLGGVICAMVAVLLILPYSLMGISLSVMVFAVLGDLFESLIKRIFQVKDSGVLLPGHGGLLDRIDSLTAAVPFFALGCLWMF